MITPEFWANETSFIDTGTVSVDCAEYDLSDKDDSQTVAERMRDTFDKFGLVIVKNTGMQDLTDMQRVAKYVVEKPMEYTGGANAREGIVENVYETGAPKEAHLHYHHEMAYVSKSTKMLGFCCQDAVPNKGWSFVSDQTSLTKEILQTPLGQKLKEKGICYVRCLTDRNVYSANSAGVYNHWQRSFQTEDPEEAVARAAERGLVCEWGTDPSGKGGKYLVTKFYVSAFEYCPATNKNIMYSSVADDAMWFDTWPGVMEMPSAHRPLKLLFGDDSEFTREEFKEWVELYDKFGVPIKWEQGDIAVVCNWRWAHGRPAYSLEEGEKRTLGVILGETFDRVGALDDKW